ncbi:Thiamine biosynthesis lipoprotein ApbE [Desulfamplus magnetovallimortis]|uniref:FAD:protein FMN transferase n=1 Tax=Desulfamplus magnetovallimortis TaxID=1246637 RepID=A0A1W1H577_9BACT|nr:FAD:protein FMN transferase [Desulfamplus magnetovallimortis]SLM27518.1 Thiamine biosynthesis lipoprotein ApbE [Desulfamplus magnetovallimortis]
MGTTYHIKVVIPIADTNGYLPSHIKAKKEIKEGIDAKLKAVNQSMSVYSKSSEISAFNKASKNEITEISRDFAYVMSIGERLYTITNGAWDATLKPLVDLWGFGTERQLKRLPSPETVKERLSHTGFNHISLSGNKNQMTSGPILEKKLDGITLDLGSIAKGFGVDAVSEMLIKNGYENFLVEIGGEVAAHGVKKPSTPWMVGVTRPDKGGNPNAIYASFELKNRALATSGDYRNFIELEGKTYSHIINPVTGYPVSNGVVSASVISDNCTFADGLATALMVMGAEKGVELVNSIEGTECLIVTRDTNGKLKDHISKEFPGSNQK